MEPNTGQDDLMSDDTKAGGRPDEEPPGGLKEELVETIRSCLHHAGPIDGTTEIADLIHDSIDLVELITVVSDRYRIRFDLFEMDDVRSVDDLVAYVERRRGAAAPPDPLDRF
jgi:acyl carrier protein